MDEPRDHSSGYSPALTSRLTERLAQRASGRAGVVDTEHPSALYRRAAGWVEQRLPLLAHLRARYDVGGETAAQGQPLVMGQPMSATADTPSQFGQIASQGERILRKAEDSVSRPSPAGSAPAPQVRYRVSRRPSYAALSTDPVRLTDSLRPSATVEAAGSVIGSEPRPGGGKRAAGFDDESPTAIENREASEPVGGATTSAAKNATESSVQHILFNTPASTIDPAPGRVVQRGATPSTMTAGLRAPAELTLKRDDASAAGANRKALAGAEVPASRRVDASGASRESAASGEHHTTIPPSAIVQRQQSPAELALLKSDDRPAGRENAPPTGAAEVLDIRAGDGPRQSREPAAGVELRTSIPPSTIVQEQPAPADLIFLKRDDSPYAGRENRDAAPIDATDGSGLKRRRAIDNRPSANAYAEAEAGAPASGFDGDSSSQKLVAPTLNQRQMSQVTDPLVLQRASVEKTHATGEAPSAQTTDRDHAATLENSGLNQALSAGEGSAAVLSGEAQFGNSTPSHESGLQRIIQAAEPLILRKARPGENEAQEETQSAAPRQRPAISEQQTATAARPPDEHAKGSGLSGAALSRLVTPNASSMAVQRAAVDASSLPIVKSESLTAVLPIQRPASSPRRLTAPTSKERIGAQPLVSPEIRTSKAGSEPAIVWRKSASEFPAGAVASTQSWNGAGFVARQEDGSVSAASSPSVGSSVLNNAEPDTSAVESNGGIDVDKIIRALRKKLAIERERRGTGR